MKPNDDAKSAGETADLEVERLCDVACIAAQVLDRYESVRDRMTDPAVSAMQPLMTQLRQALEPPAQVIPLVPKDDPIQPGSRWVRWQNGNVFHGAIGIVEEVDGDMVRGRFVKSPHLYELGFKFPRESFLRRFLPESDQGVASMKLREWSPDE